MQGENEIGDSLSDSDALTDRVTLGQEIRKLRKARSKTLADIAAATGRSINFISQLERGLAEAPISDLKRIALTLGVPLTWFFVADAQPAHEINRVVRKGGRRHLGSAASGLSEELLSPSIGGKFDMFLSTFRPGASHGPVKAKDTEEEGYIVAGQLDMWIDNNHVYLNPGDSFRIAGEPYRWENKGDVDVVVIWVIAPPSA
ncbi:XRE family transcriptional regulator [Pseudomonas putida]|uniref:helix-turn-helix domain-containing protein n=1 Tax=Pseudomonas putida TaxID=303 RepID=UPI00300F5040